MIAAGLQWRGRRGAVRRAADGAIAQLGERLDRTQEVAGSSPASSIPRTAPPPSSDERRGDEASQLLE